MHGIKVCVLNALSATKQRISDLVMLNHIFKIVSYTNITPEFTGQTEVVDVASELLVEIFRDKGKHTRLAAGVDELPKNFSLELEFIVQIEPQ